MIVSPRVPGSGCRSAFARTPVISPAAPITSGSGCPAADRWSMPSASRITPVMPARRPGAVTSSSRKARRFSRVGGTPAAASRPDMAAPPGPVARIPFGGATSADARSPSAPIRRP